MNTNGVFGLKAFETWVKDLLIPAMEEGSGKVLTEQQKKTIITVAKDGKRMNEQSMAKVLQWIDTYGTELENADKVINYPLPICTHRNTLYHTHLIFFYSFGYKGNRIALNIQTYRI